MVSYSEDFEEEFEEVEEEEFEDADPIDCEDEVYGILEMLGGLEMVEQFKKLQESEVFLIDHARMQEMQECFKIIKKGIGSSDKKATVVCRYSDLAKDTGAIDIEGLQVLMKDAAWFSAAAGIADFTEVYHLANNKVRIEFTFNGIMHPVGKAE